MSVKDIASLLRDLESQINQLDELALKKALKLNVDKMLRIVFQHCTHFRNNTPQHPSISSKDAAVPSLADAGVRRFKKKAKL